MRARVSFRTKIVLLPVIAGLAFFLLVGANLVLGTRSESSLSSIDKVHFPLLLTSRQLTYDIQRIHRGYQDAAGAQDLELLKAIEPIEAGFSQNLDELANNGSDATTIVSLRNDFTHYTTTAKRVTKELVAAGENDVAASVEELQRAYQAVVRHLDGVVELTKTSTAQAFAAARDATASGNKFTITIAIICLVVLSALSFWIVRNVMRALGTSTHFVSTAAAEILAVAKQTEANAAEEAAFVDETRRAMEGLVESASAIAGSAAEVLDRAEQSAVASRTIASRISELNAQAARITDISEVIRRIADRSDILALNASLEGTRAGEFGAGFGLVGVEMRRLAESVTGAVRQIKQLANEMRDVSQSAVAATDEGQKLAAETTLTSKQITMITSQQRSATLQITQSMDEIQQFTRQALGGAKLTRSAAGELVSTTADLTTQFGVRRTVAEPTDS